MCSKTLLVYLWTVFTSSKYILTVKSSSQDELGWLIALSVHFYLLFDLNSPVGASFGCTYKTLVPSYPPTYTQHESQANTAN